jgi:hypothetical protein
MFSFLLLLVLFIFRENPISLNLLPPSPQQTYRTRLFPSFVRNMQIINNSIPRIDTILPTRQNADINPNFVSMIVYVCFVYLIQFVIQILHPCYKQTTTSIESESLPTPPYIESHIPQQQRKNLLQNNGYCLNHRKHTHSDKIIVSLHRTKK